MNSYVEESCLLRESFDIQIVPIRFVKKMDQIGRFAFGKLILTGRLLFAVLREMFLFKPELVYMTPAPTGWAFYRDLMLVEIMKLFPVKVILHLHGQGICEASRVPWRKYLYRQFFRHTEVICVSERLFFDIESVFSETPHIVTNALPENERYQEDRSGERISSPPVKVLYLSNLTKGKGLLEFLDALRILNESCKIDFIAHIAGPPNDVNEEELKAELVERNLAGRVEYLGPQYGEDKHLCFAWADMFVFPTKIDVFGIVMLEAMQHRVPVIASRMAAIPDVVKDGETGFLVEPGSVQDLAEKMEQLAKDPELQLQMGQRGYEHYKAQFTVDIYERNLKMVFEKVLGKGKEPV